MVPVTPPESDPTGPPTKPTVNQGIALEDLSHSQNEQLCSQIMKDILINVVSCSEDGSHGPTIGQTSCESATCSLGGIDPPADLALAISSLVRRRNARYVRKTLYNCLGCGIILKNTSFCVCGARIILSHHGVVFAGILSNTAGLANITSCTCFTTVDPVSPSHENDDEDKLVLDTSGSLFLEHEVLIRSHSILKVSPSALQKAEHSNIA